MMSLMFRKVLSERLNRVDEETQRFQAAFDRHTDAFERLMAAFDRNEQLHREMSERQRARKREPGWCDDPVAKTLRRETDEILRAMKARNLSGTRRAEEDLAEWEAEREKSRVLRRELLERIDRLPPPARAA
jgi:hypothetical protein